MKSEAKKMTSIWLLVVVFLISFSSARADEADSSPSDCSSAWSFFNKIREPLQNPQLVDSFEEPGLYVIKLIGGPDDPAIDYHAIAYVSDGKKAWKTHYCATNDLHWISCEARDRLRAGRPGALVHYEPLNSHEAHALVGHIKSQANKVYWGYQLPSKVTYEGFRFNIGTLRNMRLNSNCYMMPALMCEWASKRNVMRACGAASEIMGATDRAVMAAGVITGGLQDVDQGWKNSDPLQYAFGGMMTLGGTALAAEAVVVGAAPLVPVSALAAGASATASAAVIGAGGGALMVGAGLAGYGVGTWASQYTTVPLVNWWYGN